MMQENTSENTFLSTTGSDYFSSDTKPVPCKSESIDDNIKIEPSDNNLNYSELNEETKAKKSKPNPRYTLSNYKRSFVKMNDIYQRINNSDRPKHSRFNSKFSNYKRSFVPMNKSESSNNSMIKLESSDNNVMKRESSNNNTIKLESSDNNMIKRESSNNDTIHLESSDNNIIKLESSNNNTIKLASSDNNIIKRESSNNDTIKLESSDNNIVKRESNDNNIIKRELNDNDMINRESSNNNIIKRESNDNNMINRESSDNNLNNNELNKETKAKKPKPNPRYTLSDYKRSFVKRDTINQSINNIDRQLFTATNKINENVNFSTTFHCYDNRKMTCKQRGYINKYGNQLNQPYHTGYFHREMRPVYNDNHMVSPTNHFINMYSSNTAPIEINDNPIKSTIAYKSDEHNESVNAFDNLQNNQSESVQNNTVLSNKQTVKFSIHHATFITIPSTCNNQLKIINENGYAGKNDQTGPGSDIGMLENSNYSTPALEESNNLSIAVVSFNNTIQHYTSKNVFIFNDNYEKMLTGNNIDKKIKKLSICHVANINTCKQQCPNIGNAGIILKYDPKPSDQARRNNFLGDNNTNNSVKIVNESQNSTTNKSENTILNAYNSDLTKQTEHLSIRHVVYISIRSSGNRKRHHNVYDEWELLKNGLDAIRQKYDQTEPTTDIMIHTKCLNNSTDQNKMNNLSVQRLTGVNITEKHRNRRENATEYEFFKRNAELSFHKNTVSASKKKPDGTTPFKTENNFINSSIITNDQDNNINIINSVDDSQNNGANESIKNNTMRTGIFSNNSYENIQTMTSSQHPVVCFDTRYNNREVLLGNLKRDFSESVHNILDKLEYSNANTNNDFTPAITLLTNTYIPTNNSLNLPNEIARKSSTHTANASMSKEKMTPKVSKICLDRKKRLNKTRQSISKLFMHLRNNTQSTSQINIDNVVVDLDNTPNTVIHIDDHNEPRTSNVGQDSLIIIPDDNVKMKACSTPKSKGPLNHSTPRKKASLDDLILAQSNNNTNLQSFNADLTKEINKSSFLTVDLTTETIKTEPTVIDLDNTTDNDVTVVSVSNASSMSGDSDVTIIKKPMNRKLRKFTHGIANLNVSEKGKLLELITQTIFTGCTVPVNLQRRLSNIQKDLPRTPDTAEDTYIKEVILGGKASRSSIGSNVYHPDRQKGNQKGLRMIVVDGSNVAMEHSRRRLFSVRGLQICIDYFLRRGHVVKAFVPRFRCKYGMSTDGRLLDFLERKGLVVYTPSREIQGKTVTPYDDRYILQCAAEFDGVVVSGDNYKDLIHENPRWKFVVENRLLPFTWVNDMIMFPKDPLGRSGPTLENFLKH